MYDMPASWDTPVVDKVEFYRDAASEWRWRFINADNGKIMADSGEGYKNLSDAEAAVERVIGRSRVSLSLNMEKPDAPD